MKDFLEKLIKIPSRFVAFAVVVCLVLTAVTSGQAAVLASGDVAEVQAAEISDTSEGTEAEASGEVTARSAVTSGESEATEATEPDSETAATAKIEESLAESKESESESETETAVTESEEPEYLEYDPQPTTMAEVQAWADAYEASGYDLDAKPHWQYEVDSALMPDGWRCDYLEDENYSDGVYWSIFPKPQTLVSGTVNVYNASNAPVQSSVSLADAIAYVNGDPLSVFTIELTANELLSAMGKITNTAGVTITSDTGNNWEITWLGGDTDPDNSRHFKVAGGNLIIGDGITLEGKNSGGGIWVTTSGDGITPGSLTMESGTIQNCARNDSSRGSGGAVYVQSNSTFVMSGGMIINNMAEQSGGGVTIAAGGTFTMTGGSITKNSAGKYGGGVYIEGTAAVFETVNASTAETKFYMSGGDITENFAPDLGGGVALRYNALMELSGSALITKNETTESFGGVSVDFSTFIMNGGTISGNTAITTTVPTSYSTTTNGGGVGVMGGVFTMNGGTISKNETTDTTLTKAGYGGGVWVGWGSATLYGTTKAYDYPSTFTMNGGIISGNKAGNAGGGVWVCGGSTFTMTSDNAEIAYNTTNAYGGGVGVCAFLYKDAELDATKPEKPSTFNLNGGLIYGNYADETGGGVIVGASNFNMSGGQIYANVTQSTGGGVRVGQFHDAGSPSTFTMTGGTIGGQKLFGTNALASGGSVSIDANGAQQAANAGEGNYAESHGGGVYVEEGTTFKMSDGTICYNSTNSYTGGVGVRESYFEMSGGNIDSNYATSTGGGVGLAASTFWMSDGKIQNNETDSSAGGVIVAASTVYGNFHEAASTFYMTGGEITGNESLLNGGGVDVRDKSVFYMGTGSYTPAIDATTGWIGSGTFSAQSGAGTPTISENKAHLAGGGVFIGTYGTAAGDSYATFQKDSAQFYMYDGAIIDGNQTEYDSRTQVGSWYRVQLYGGGVFVGWGCSLTMAGGDIINNTSAYLGGGVGVAGATFTMSGGSISGNETNKTLNYNDGSGNYMNPNDTSAPLEAFGGGVWIGQIFTRTDNSGGAATQTEGSTFTMTGGVIGGTKGYYNDGTSGAATGYYGNYATDSGGGVFVGANSKFTMSGSAQIDHNETTQNGGGVYVGKGLYGTADSEFIMNNGYILNNQSVYDGGGVYVGGSTFNMRDGYISSNCTIDSAATSGGVYVGKSGDGNYYGKFTMSGGIIGGYAGYHNTTNHLAAVSQVGGPYYGNYAENSGGGVYVATDCTFTMRGESEINYNQTNYQGGGVYVQNPGSIGGAEPFTMTHGYILNNQSLYQGGGVCLDIGVTFTLNDGCYISGNKTTSTNTNILSPIASGGGVYMYTGCTLNIKGGLIGGTDYYDGTTPSVAGGPYYGNQSWYRGGGVYAKAATVNMTGGSVAYNIADRGGVGQQGGGVFMDGGKLTMTNAVIECNKATYGGGVVASAATIEMNSGAIVRDNYATMNTDGGGGGILLTAAATMEMKDNALITGNTASAAGGGLKVESSSKLTMNDSAIISNNTADGTGTGKKGGGGAAVNSATLIMNDSATISGNTGNGADGGGGILAYTAATIAMNSGTTISGNNTTGSGGGIHSIGTSVVTLDGATVTGNFASTNGGGIYTASSGMLTVKNSTNITNNVTLGNGGGIYTTYGFGSAEKAGEGTPTKYYANLSIDGATRFTGNRAAFSTKHPFSEQGITGTTMATRVDSLSIYDAATVSAANNWDVNYGYTPHIYTVIFNPNGGTFANVSAENLEYLYISSSYITSNLKDLGYVLDPATNKIMYDNNQTAAAANIDLVNAAGITLPDGSTLLTISDGDTMVEVPTKAGSQFARWNTAAGTLLDLTTMTFASTGGVADASTPSNNKSGIVYAQWNTYTIAVELTDGLTWADLAGNVAVTFDSASGVEMTAIFTEGNDYYTLYPAAGAVNGITTLGTSTWNVSVDLPLQNPYYSIKSITTASGTAGPSSVTPGDADNCEILITIGQNTAPWGHWFSHSR